MGVTGFDLAGYEASHPDPTVHAAGIRGGPSRRPGHHRAHAVSCSTTVPLVRRALELRPDRIAHGASAAADPRLMAALIERGITLDLCPTSNVQAGTVATFAEHPLPALLRAGVPVTINTDDTTISDITLSEEWLSCVASLGLTLARAVAMQPARPATPAFVDEPTPRSAARASSERGQLGSRAAASAATTRSTQRGADEELLAGGLPGVGANGVEVERAGQRDLVGVVAGEGGGELVDHPLAQAHHALQAELAEERA